MKNLNLQSNKDPHLWKIIDENIYFETQQRDKHHAEINRLQDLQKKEHLLYVQKCMNKFFEIAPLIPDAVLSARDDLGLEISREAYLDICNNNLELGEKVFSDFYTKV